MMRGIDIELIKETFCCNSSADVELIHRPEIVDIDTVDGLSQLLNTFTNGL
jgi:hypothetical protein